MQSLGPYLRELRQARGLSLAEVARTTRVGQRYLEALEADSLNHLPAPAFTKGFIRAYCQVLNEPPDEALARYREIIGESLTRVPPVTLARTQESRWRSPVLISLVLLIVLGLSLFVLTLALQSRRPKVASPPPAAAPSAPAVTPQVVLPAEQPARAAEAGPSRLVARASEPTWISVQTDDGQVVQELLPAGATREWTSTKRFVVTIGNAGGVSLELNGRPIPPLGNKGTVIRELVLPRDAEASKP